MVPGNNRTPGPMEDQQDSPCVTKLSPQTAPAPSRFQFNSRVGQVQPMHVASRVSRDDGLAPQALPCESCASKVLIAAS